MNAFARTTGLLASIILAATSAPANSKPAARVGDSHVCPLLAGATPHAGGAILAPGATNVRICGKPAAVVGTPAKCNGPANSIIKGSSTVRIGGKPAARVGDGTAHGGTITSGCASVRIGG